MSTMPLLPTTTPDSTAWKEATHIHVSRALKNSGTLKAHYVIIVGSNQPGLLDYFVA